MNNIKMNRKSGRKLKELCLVGLFSFHSFEHYVEAVNPL